MHTVSKGLKIKGKTVPITLSEKIWTAFEDICKKENIHDFDLAMRIFEVKGKSNFTLAIQLFVFIYNYPKEISGSAISEVFKLCHK